MSLFNSREFWTADINITNLVDGNSLLVATVGAVDCIFLGSHDGYLRIYLPTNTEPTVQKPSDLIYETLFPSPVLQIAMASLISRTLEKQLAVLHPRSIAIYHVQLVNSSNEKVLSLKHAYTHTLSRATHSFVCGTFGKGKGRDFICVQSLNGMTSFFEQESSAFEVQLPDILLPGPFQYLFTIDAFLFQDVNQNLTVYSYENLSEGNRKQLSPMWIHNIGENILDINCQQFGEGELNILILCERNYYNLSDGGKITWMKRLEYRPMCFTTYLNGETYQVMSLITTEYQTINLYDGTCLKWCTKLDFIPIALSLTKIETLSGLLTLLSDTGHLQCVYLGTVPSLYIIPPTIEPDINLQEAEKELKRLQTEITETDVGSNISEDVLSIKLTVNRKITETDRPMCNVTLDLLTQTPINKVQILFVVEAPLVSEVNTLTISSVLSKETISTQIYVGKTGSISNLMVKAVVSYMLSSGVPKVVQKVDSLPFEVALTKCGAAKDALMKLTLVTNKPTCPLNELFPGSEGTTNAIGLRSINSSDTVTLVAAKTSQRYRLQADTLEDMTLVMAALVEGLEKKFEKTSDFNLTFAGPLPLQSYFEAVERHFELITRRRTKKEQLAHRTTQYRTIQKKVLLTLKDLSPKPSSSLYKVLDDTYGMIRTSISELEKLESELQESRCRLSALSRLMLILLNIMTNKGTDLQYLKHVFYPALYDGDDQGWLEIQYATLSLLLRTAFAKSSKDQNKPSDLTLEPLSDVSKLCKLFSTIVDRATKGTSLLERNEFDEERESLPTLPSVKDWEVQKVNLLPMGSKLVDLSLPVTVKPPNKPKVAPKAAVPVNIPEETEVIIETKEMPSQESASEFEKKSVIVTKKTPDQSTIDDDAIWDIGLDEMNI